MAKRFFDLKGGKKAREFKFEEREDTPLTETREEEHEGRVGERLEEKYNEFLKTLAAKAKPEKSDSVESETEEKAQKKRNSVGWLGLLWRLVVLGGLIFLLFQGSNFISQVEIVLEVQKETQEKTFSVFFKKDPQQTGFLNNQFVLPLYSFEKSFNYSQDYPATGEGEVRSYSRGKIIVYNEATQTPQVLVAQTRFESPQGKIFRLQKRVVVPGYDQNGPGMLEVEVVADQPGEEYNLEPTRFTLPGLAGTAKFEKIYGVSKEKFSGGALGVGKVVTAEDIKLAKEKIIEFAYETAKAEVLKEVPESLKLLDKAIQFNPGKPLTSAVGTPEKTHAEISGSLSIWVFNENELKELINEKMREEQTLRTDWVSTTYQIFYENPEIDLSNQSMTLRVKVKRDIQAYVDTLEFKQKIAGKDLEEVKKELLKLEGVKKIRVSVWPFWIKRAPANLDTLKIRVE